MQYPRGHCCRCGERLYARIDGDYQCHNCGARFADETGASDTLLDS